jgi:hypothetical protein
VKTAAKCLSEVATRHVAAYLDGLGANTLADHADDIVDLVLDTLAEPSRDMLEAAREELNRALPTGGVTSAYQRALVRALWRAMLERAER